MYVTFSEERQQQDTGDKYMSVYGSDRDGVDSGTIRFWGWNDTVNIQGGNTIVIRGLKVAPETVWDESAYKYVVNPQGKKNLVHSFRTAVEDVSSVDGINALFGTA